MVFSSASIVTGTFGFLMKSKKRDQCIFHLVFNSREAIAAIIGDTVVFLIHRVSIDDSCDVTSLNCEIDFFNFSDLYCFAVEIRVRDVICSALRLIAVITSLKK